MKTKYCTKCKTERPVDDFSLKSKTTGKRQTYCKPCNRVYQRAHYVNNKNVYVKKAAVHREATRKAVRRKVWEYLLGHPCVDCGEKDPVILEFDHQREKLSNVSCLVSTGATWRRVKNEIDKCEVRCRNCHQRKTAKELGWYDGLVDWSTYNLAPSSNG